MISTTQEALLLAVVVPFAFNPGAHDTGATVGMPYASGSVALWPALAIASLKALPVLLILVGVAASFVMGSNDVANATGALLLVHITSAQTAGAIGGAGLFCGGLIWGRRILDRVAFDVVKLDLAMASAAQGVQALVVILAVSQALFTSMNQAPIAAMAGTGIARGRRTVNRAQLAGILRGWLIGPAAGLLLACLIESAVR